MANNPTSSKNRKANNHPITQTQTSAIMPSLGKVCAPQEEANE